MRYLSGDEEKKALEYLAKAAFVARNSSCSQRKCGSVIVNNDVMIGAGYNSPPGNLESQRRCDCDKDLLEKKVTDKTCCVHAEERAIFNALAVNHDYISGSRLYFVSIDINGEPKRAGKPYCTVCSKMALDVGIAEFVLWHDEGVCVYDTEEYNDLSYRYSERE